MSNQSPTASSKDQFPHTDVANNEEGRTPERTDTGRNAGGREKNQPNATQSHRTPGSAEGERDPDEQSR